ncbi:MAG TPA: UPF0182 family protein [Longimicrobiales bacterium]|nr:UPF0182 family protein [Longimicrobiales bacterium]
MIRRPGRILIYVGLVALAALLAAQALVELYTDALWYREVGYLAVFWTRLGAAALVRSAAAVLGAGVVLLNLWVVARQLGPVHLRRRYGNLEIAEQVPRSYLIAGILVAAVLAGWWLSGLEFGGDDALRVLAWLRQARWGATDPVFGRDLSFFVFSLPAYFSIVDFLFLATIWSILLVLLGYVLVGSIHWRQSRLEVSDPARAHFTILVAAIVLLVGVRYWLDRYALLLEGTGVRGSLGYTDLHARLPADIGLALLALLAAGALVYGAVRRVWGPPLIAVGALIAAAVLAGHLYPALVQKLRVEPNELARERPYIGWNIEYTLRAYGLDGLQRRAYAYRSAPVAEWEALAPGLSRLPVWDPEPLETAFNQTQTGFGYYKFPDIDFDRYVVPGVGPTQVAIGAREFTPEGLPPGSRSWISQRLNPKYVRGMGAVVTPASESRPDGEPVLWLSGVDTLKFDSAAAPPQLRLLNPSIFIGETLSGYVILVPRRDTAFTGTPGRDFPAGIRLDSWPRLLAFAWRFGDKNLLFSGELSPDSRLVFRRSVRQRLEALAPFLVWDASPYPVILDGRIVWIVDGYTAGSTFPLSRAEELEGIGRVRYLRGSVKATVDAVTGAVRLYAVGPTDPFLETYRRIFPELIQPWTRMPAAVQAHLRYPNLLFETQAAILREYHLTNPRDFYASLDVWALPPGAPGPGARPYRPMHTMMPLPGEARSEFLLTMPFVARERQNMTALLAARSDPPAYGELVLYELPRDQQIPGPGQVQALIEQDPTISPQLTLWRQAGSDVNLGHLRVVPVDGGFLYIQPLFLSAQSSGNPIPELQRVIASDGGKVVMAMSLPEAVQGLRAAQSGSAPPARTITLRPTTGAAAELPRRALDLLDRAERLLRNGDFAGFGAALADLRALLQSQAKPARP